MLTAWIQAAHVFTEAHGRVRWRNVFGAYGQACTRSVYICVSVCTQWAAGLEAPHQSARLCFCSCTSSCFGPESHIRCFTASSSISLSSLLVPFHPWSRGLACPGFSSPQNSLSSCQQPGKWQSYSARRASDPLITHTPSPRLPIWWCHDIGQIEWAALLPAL